MYPKKVYTYVTTKEYDEWLEEQSYKEQVQIDERLLNIELEGHFGDHRNLEEHLWELKWVNGRRVYYAHIEQFNLILLLGGNKNGQEKDITKARKILRKYTA